MSRLSAITREGRGFTLVELLVAIAVAIILMGCLAAIYSTGAQITGHAMERVEAWREARGVLGLLERDLKHLGMPGAVGNGEARVPLLAISKTAEGGREMQFLAMSADTVGRVRYRCVWNPEGKTWCLKRSWHAGLQGDDAWIEEEVAGHLWDFTIRSGDSGGDNIEYYDRLPPWVEVRFRVVGERVAARLKHLPVTAETWGKVSDPVYRQVIEPCQQEFVLKVRLAMAQKRL